MSSRQSGFSLVELMVAMVIGLVLVAGVTQVFLTSKRTYSYQQSLARIQENGRIALEFLSRDIRMAGYTGCASGSYTSITNTLNSTSVSYDFSTGVRGFDVTETVPADLASLDPAPLLNTDVLIVRGPVGDGVKVIKNNSSAQLFSGVTSTEVGGCLGSPATDKISGICKGDILMVADCTKARVFQAGNIQVASGELNITHPTSGTPGNAAPGSWGGASAPESEKFGTDSEIIKMNTVFYYIGQGAGGQPSLYQSIVPGVTNEILEGVENMQLLYGRDTTGDGVPESYLAASDVGSANWGQVVGVRVQLLMRSIENNVTDKVQLYSFNGDTAINPADRRLRQVFVSTVGLRSRIP